MNWKNYYFESEQDEIDEVKKGTFHIDFNSAMIHEIGRKDLYLDFDGVILDTFPVLLELIESNGIDKHNVSEVIAFLSKIDWGKVIAEAPQINNSIENINKLIASKLFNVRTLNHVTCIEEFLYKVAILINNVSGIKIVSVYRAIPKAKADGICPKGAILVDDYSVNLREWEAAGGISVKFSTEDEPDSPFIVIDHLDTLIELEKEGKLEVPKVMVKK